MLTERGVKRDSTKQWILSAILAKLQDCCQHAETHVDFREDRLGLREASREIRIDSPQASLLQNGETIAGRNRLRWFQWFLWHDVLTLSQRVVARSSMDWWFFTSPATGDGHALPWEKRFWKQWEHWTMLDSLGVDLKIHQTGIKCLLHCNYFTACICMLYWHWDLHHERCRNIATVWSDLTSAMTR